MSKQTRQTPELIPYPSQEDIDTRQTEINRICEDINTINQIYTDLSTLVTDQTPDINAVEFNVTETHHHTKQGLIHLKKAESYQRANPLTKFLTIATSTVIGTAIGGPVGLVVGLKIGCIATAAIGAVAGGLAGKTYHERVYRKPISPK